MSQNSPKPLNWRVNARPCLVNAVRAGHAARVLHRHGLMPESASQSHRVIESVIEAAIAARGLPVPKDGIAAGTNGRQRSAGSHQLKRDLFHQHWLSGNSRLLSGSEQRVLAELLLDCPLSERNSLLYVDYKTATPPSMSQRESALRFATARKFYRIMARKARKAAGR